MKNKIVIAAALASALVLGILASIDFSILAQPNKKSFKAELGGYQEVASVSTNGFGTFEAQVSSDQASMAYELSYSGLQANITQAHIHFGQSGVNGGILIYLCQTEAFPDPTGLAPACPQEGTVTGTLTAANLSGSPEQLLDAGEFDELLNAMQAGVTYINVHTEVAEGLDRGEIRGQIN